MDEFPAIIAGLREGGSRPQGQSCSGSVVASRKIVIAAHCADAAGQKSFLYGLDDLNAGGGFRTQVVEYKKHPRYVNFDQGYDVAVVTTADDIPVRGGKYATVATSKDAGLEAPGKNGLGFGYGKKDFDDASRDVTLDKALLPIVNGAQQCQGVGAGFKAATMICAGYNDGRVTILPGDSGGPLIVDGKIIGLASWSRSDFKWYSIYARLTNDMGDWVAAEIGNNNPPGEGKLTVSPASGTASPGGFLNATVSVEGVSVTLDATGVQFKPFFNPQSVHAGGTSRMTVIAPFQRGTYPITITGGALKTTYTLTVS
ncbi:trypsin-like serine protease [Kibdelosporangium philippinense]|uniref:Trypsin-like serine protease n=1 Tax=Kibdelosporangium philippinense TaxID=211113 RepID=A0ABS8ZE69_9PSEU|nr:trypsin-like serine protease [Kibdelosporangium philippinense]MCE7006121.1 trypsin-like serine protease [Kibdelosporangium philippinense]